MMESFLSTLGDLIIQFQKGSFSSHSVENLIATGFKKHAWLKAVRKNRFVIY